MKKAKTPCALTIAGSDNSAGAGIQADLKTFMAFGCHGLTAVTCVVAEVPGKVLSVTPIPAPRVSEQIALSFEAFPVTAAKTGMLYSRSIIRAVATELAKYRPQLVVDPVMIASSGDPLLQRDAIGAYWREIFPLSTLVTPNLDELTFLLSTQRPKTLTQMVAAARELSSRIGCAVLAKGGHLGGKVATDVLVHGSSVDIFEEPFIRGAETHGTGCTFSAAITAALAQGETLVDAVAQAKEFITRAIRDSHCWLHPQTSQKTSILNHFR